jgi:hypothetical protein
MSDPIQKIGSIQIPLHQESQRQTGASSKNEEFEAYLNRKGIEHVERVQARGEFDGVDEIVAQSVYLQTSGKF